MSPNFNHLMERIGFFFIPYIYFNWFIIWSKQIPLLPPVMFHAFSFFPLVLCKVLSFSWQLSQFLCSHFLFIPGQATKETNYTISVSAHWQSCFIGPLLPKLYNCPVCLLQLEYLGPCASLSCNTLSQSERSSWPPPAPWHLSSPLKFLSLVILSESQNTTDGCLIKHLFYLE